MSRFSLLRLTLLGCTLPLLTACGRTTDAPRTDTVAATTSSEPVRGLPLASGAAAGLGNARGWWRIVGDSAPGVSAMTADERMAWRGREAQYTDSVARLGAVSCASPDYLTRTVPADSLLDAGYRLRPGALGLPIGGTVTVTEVSCRHAEWREAGATLYWLTSSRIYTVWDGVFFVLERRP